MVGRESATPPVRPPMADLFRTFLIIGCLSFGGPAGQIAMMHKVIVEEKRWLDEHSYLTALNFCMLLPGPEAMQLATYVGWRLHGIRGGLVTGLLFVLPGAALMLCLALAYAAFGQLPVAEALFLGIKAAVLAIVIEALLRIGRRALKRRSDWLIAGIAFASMFLLDVPFPVIVLAAALSGYLRASEATAAAPPTASTPVTLAQTLRTASTWLAIWIAPLAAIALVLGGDHVLTKIAWFFSKLAVVTFGGAYAVLAYMAQAVVSGYGWLSAGEMMDALGLAETTPGPLILVTEFVATLAAWRQGGGPPAAMGALGAVVALWATFAPCFLWIFVGAPFVERINAEPRLRSALAAVTAAVVGVILKLTLWFALHVFFAGVDTVTWWPLRVTLPDPATLRPLTLLLSSLACLLLFVLHRSIFATLVACAGLSLALHSLT